MTTFDPADEDVLAGLVERTLDRAALPSHSVVATARSEGLPIADDPDPVAAVASLRRLPPAVLDPLAARLTRTQTLAAAAQGFATSFGGVATLPLRMSTDAAAALWFATRAASGAMGAFGFPVETERGRALLRAGLLQVTGVSAAATGLQGVMATATRQLAADPRGTRLVASSARMLVRRVGMACGRHQAVRLAPVVGGLVGAGLNGSAVHLLARRARRHYRTLLEEWQAAIDQGDLQELAGWHPLPPPPQRQLPPASRRR